MLPVVQLHLRDVPLLRAPGMADLLQVLWCPFDHPPQPKPTTALFWRSAAAVTDILGTPPEPVAVQYEGYVPEPCLLDPEDVMEYPHLTRTVVKPPRMLSMLNSPLSRSAARSAPASCPARRARGA